jgi:tripartite-type tricarboxylate transporter receptor subunit TctC
MANLTRRLALLGVTAFSLEARAQANFPDRPLKLVVGFAPGGALDILARIIAPELSEQLGRTILIENRPGANGEVAAAAVAKSPPDGSIFYLASNGSALSNGLEPKLGYDVRKDLIPVAFVGINPLLFVARPTLPAKTVAALIELARAQPGKLNGASAGTGGITHLALELLKAMAQVDIVHVPYKGGGLVLTDLMGGTVDVYFGGFTPTLPPVRSGQLIALGQTGSKRSAAAPDIPTLAESGLTGYEATLSYGIFLPPGSPAPLVEKLHDAVEATMRKPEVVKKFIELGVDPIYGTSAEFAAYFNADLEKWVKLARKLGVGST